MGDLHMPLHTGYDDDLGGNKRIVQYDSIKTHNLHRFWDEDIIKLTGITDEDCMRYTSNENIQSDDFTAWLKDSRSLLPQVYDFPDFTLDEKYLAKNKIVVAKQLNKAALRFALILNELFSSPAPSVDFKKITSTYKNGIDVSEASNIIGNNVTVFSSIASIRATSTITQISLEQKFPNCPLTIIVFAKSYPKFNTPLEALLKDKNICVKGVITEYKGKAQIVVEESQQIIIL